MITEFYAVRSSGVPRIGKFALYRCIPLVVSQLNTRVTAFLSIFSPIILAFLEGVKRISQGISCVNRSTRRIWRSRKLFFARLRVS